MSATYEEDRATIDNAHLCGRSQRPRARWLRLRTPGWRRLQDLVHPAPAVPKPVGSPLVHTLAIASHALAGEPIRVLSANLWHDWPHYRRQYARLEAFAQLVEAERADIVLLQEVARTPRLHVDAWLAQRLGMAGFYVCAGANPALSGVEEGVAILSRFPLATPQVRQWVLRGLPFARRVVLGAAAATPNGALWVFSVHLGLLRGQNAKQVADLPIWVAQVAGSLPALIGGDFNAAERSPQMVRMRQHWLDTFRQMHPYADATTHEVRWPWGSVALRHRLDYIFLRPGEPLWQVVAARHLEAPGEPHSDHRAVLVQLLAG